MSRKSTYLAVCFFLVLGLSDGGESATMVAHWRFDNDATDSSGDIDGTLMSGAGRHLHYNRHRSRHLVSERSGSR